MIKKRIQIRKKKQRPLNIPYKIKVLLPMPISDEFSCNFAWLNELLQFAQSKSLTLHDVSTGYIIFSLTKDDVLDCAKLNKHHTEVYYSNLHNYLNHPPRPKRMPYLGLAVMRDAARVCAPFLCSICYQNDEFPESVSVMVYKYFAYVVHENTDEPDVFKRIPAMKRPEGFVKNYVRDL